MGHSDCASEFVEIVLASYCPTIDYFSVQIQSLQQQTLTTWHCHIVDDGSPSDHLAAMQECIGDDDRFTLHAFAQNVGTYRNFERGLELCTQRATAIAFCDQDDIWLPHKLERLLMELQNSQVVLVHSDLVAIDSQGETLHASCWQFEGRSPESLTVPLLLLQNSVTGCSCLFRSELLPLVLPFPQPTTGEWLHDWWVALVAASVDRIAHIREPLVHYRQHDGNVVGAVRQSGGIGSLLRQWSAHRFRVTGKGYLAYLELADALNDRLHQQDLAAVDIEAGSWQLVKLAWYSWRSRYGAEGAALRLAGLALLKGQIV